MISEGVGQTRLSVLRPSWCSGGEVGLAGTFKGGCGDSDPKGGLMRWLQSLLFLRHPDIPLDVWVTEEQEVFEGLE